MIVSFRHKKKEESLIQEIFSFPQSFHSNHARMLSSFKIIYPLFADSHEAPHFKLSWLLQSQHPEAADLYFIPTFLFIIVIFFSANLNTN